MDYTVVFYLFIVALIFLVIGYMLAHLRQQKTLALQQMASQNAEKEMERLQAAFGSMQEEMQEKTKRLDALRIDLINEQNKVLNLEQQLAFWQTEQKKLEQQNRLQFENLAHKILSEKTEKFTHQNKENLATLLNPLQERIKEFETKIETTHKESLSRGAALRQQIEDLSRLNQTITQETHNLTAALKGDKKLQGNWGELVLRRVLEKSGLAKNREYFEQESRRNDAGQLQKPDVVIRLPDEKVMIIDSKVSLVAYERFVSEDYTGNQENARKAISDAILAHVNTLGAKNYHELYDLQSPDFVLLFIPIEPVFAIALQSEPNLYNLAFDKNIIIVTPTTLLATLRTVDSMWTGQKQKENALEIAKRAGGLYDKFVGFLDDLSKLGNQLQTVQNTYHSLQTKLDGKGSLIGKVERLKTLGARANKSIPESWKKSTLDDEA